MNKLLSKTSNYYKNVAKQTIKNIMIQLIT